MSRRSWDAAGVNQTKEETVAGGGGHPCRKGWEEVSAAYREGEMLSLAEHLRGRAAVFS